MIDAADNWCRWIEGPTEHKWHWWSMGFRPGRWCYGIDREFNTVVVKVFLWVC